MSNNARLGSTDSVGTPDTTTAERAMQLPELVHLVVSFLSRDHHTLRHAILVNHTWARAALPHLWRVGRCTSHLMRIAGPDRSVLIARHVRMLNIDEHEIHVEPALPDMPSSLPRLSRLLHLHLRLATSVRPSAILNTLNATGARLSVVNLVPHHQGPIHLAQHLVSIEGIDKYLPRIWIRLAWHCPRLTEVHLRDDTLEWAFPTRQAWAKFYQGLINFATTMGKHGHSGSGDSVNGVANSPSAASIVPAATAVAFPRLRNFGSAVREADLAALLHLFRSINWATATNVLTSGVDATAKHPPASLRSLSIRVFDIADSWRTRVFGHLADCQPSFPLLNKLEVSFPPGYIVEVENPGDIISLNRFEHLETLAIIASTPTLRTVTTSTTISTRSGASIAAGASTTSSVAGWRAGGADGFLSEARIRLRNFGDAQLRQLLSGLRGLLVLVMQVQWNVERRTGLRIVAEACPQLWTLEVFGPLDPFGLFQDGLDHVVLNQPEAAIVGPAVPVVDADGNHVYETANGMAQAQFEEPQYLPPPPPLFPRLQSLSCSSFVIGMDNHAFPPGQAFNQWLQATRHAQEILSLLKYHAPHLNALQLLPHSLIDRIILQIHRLDRGDPVAEAVRV